MSPSRRQRLCSVRSAPALAIIAAGTLSLLAGCGGEGTETTVVQQGNTTRVLSTRELRPINLQEGREIALDIAKGDKTIEKLNTEERRQLSAFVAATKPPKSKDD